MPISENETLIDSSHDPVDDENWLTLTRCRVLDWSACGLRNGVLLVLKALISLSDFASELLSERRRNRDERYSQGSCYEPANSCVHGGTSSCRLQSSGVRTH